MSEQSERMEITSTDLLANLWRSRANSIMRQLEFVNAYPDAPMREASTLRQCAAELEASGKPTGLAAVLHMANVKGETQTRKE
jgi:hypothetical protein